MKLNEFSPSKIADPRLQRLVALRQDRRKNKPRPLEYPEWLKTTTPNFTWDWHYQLLIQGAIRKVLAGAIDRLIITVPPRHGKSEMVTVRVPAYTIEKTPGFRWIIGAYSQNLANKFSRKTRRICQARGVNLSTERRAVEDWETNDDGGLRAAGVGGGVTGMGAHGIIIDDPVKSRKEANSAVYRENTHEWYKDDLYTRLEPGGFIILIITRWHEDDLAGRLIREEGAAEEGGQWTRINLPAMAEENDILGREEGEALCPARYGEKALKRIKGVLGDSFDALYQGRPVAAEGNIVKKKWFLYYATPPSPNIILEKVQSWDTASKDTELAAYSVCTTWAITRLGVYLLEEYRARLNYPALKRAVRSKAEQHHPTCVLIEDKSTGQSLIQELKDETLIPIIAIEPEGDKITRMAVESIAYESGQVYHPEQASWLPDYESEMTSFPFAPAADRVDSTSQFLRWARKRAWIFAWDSTGDGVAAEGRLETANDPSIGWAASIAGDNADLSGY